MGPNLEIGSLSASFDFKVNREPRKNGEKQIGFHPKHASAVFDIMLSMLLNS